MMQRGWQHDFIGQYRLKFVKRIIQWVSMALWASWATAAQAVPSAILQDSGVQVQRFFAASRIEQTRSARQIQSALLVRSDVSTAQAVSVNHRLQPEAVDDGFLPPEQAFRVQLAVRSTYMQATYDLAPGHYLYRDRLQFELLNSKSPSKWIPLSFPSGEWQWDEAVQRKVEIYRGQLIVRLPLPQAAQPVDIRLGWQGCSDRGLCYAPMQAKFRLNRQNAEPLAPDTTLHLALGSGLTKLGVQPGQPQAASRRGFFKRLITGAPLSEWQQPQLSWSLLVFLILGVGLSVLPCAWPMWPILLVLLGSHEQKKPVMLACAYVFGMAIVYTLLGLAAAWIGQSLAVWLNQTPLLWLYSALTLVFSLSMLGCYTLRWPAHRVAPSLGSSQNSPTCDWVAAGLAGAASAVMVSGCMSPPLLAILIWVAQEGRVVVGGLALFLLALGMGVPLLILALAARHCLPRSGPWMIKVQRLLGLGLLALAVWLIQPTLPTALAFVLMGWWLLLLSQMLNSNFEAHGWALLRTAAGTLVKLFAAVMVVGAVIGANDWRWPWAGLSSGWAQDATPSSPLSPLKPSSLQPSTALAFETITHLAQLEQALQDRRRPKLVEFYASWCASCKQLERGTLSNVKVQQALRDFRRLRVDVSQSSAEQAALLKRFQLYGPPALLLFKAENVAEPDQIWIGDPGVESFLAGLAL